MNWDDYNPCPIPNLKAGQYVVVRSFSTFSGKEPSGSGRYRIVRKVTKAGYAYVEADRYRQHREGWWHEAVARKDIGYLNYRHYLEPTLDQGNPGKKK